MQKRNNKQQNKQNKQIHINKPQKKQKTNTKRMKNKTQQSFSYMEAGRHPYSQKLFVFVRVGCRLEFF